jgi:streptogramin lyase
MVIFPLRITNISLLKAKTNYHFLFPGYWAVLLFWLATCGGASASEGVQEVALPEELSSAHSMAIDPAGRIWFTEKVGRKLAVFDPEKKEFKTYPLPSSWENVGFSRIAMGPDGEIWFTVNQWAEGTEQSRMLGLFTPADGYFTKYVLSIDSIPEELFVDAKGVIWFLASNKNSLYRVDPRTFAIKGYPVPTANSNPKNIAADQSGNIWFVEPNANKLGKFVPEREVFYEYELPTPFANPGKIAIDKNGRIWFVEMAANRIGLFYPDKKRFDEALIPTRSSSPNALVIDDDGNIWFLEYRGNKVGVFNPTSGHFHEYDIPNFNSLPGELVLDRKRSLLWFTQGATEAKRLGMLSIKDALAKNN